MAFHVSTSCACFGVDAWRQTGATQLTPKSYACLAVPRCLSGIPPRCFMRTESAAAVRASTQVKSWSRMSIEMNGSGSIMHSHSAKYSSGLNTEYDVIVTVTKPSATLAHTR